MSGISLGSFITLNDIPKLLDYGTINTLKEKAKAGVNNEIIQSLHWTGGRYRQVSNNYHVCILGDGRMVYTLPFYETPTATYLRNSGTIAIALCCCYNANSNDLGDYPPTLPQIESISQLVAKISDVIKNPITPFSVMTHGEMADREDGIGNYSEYGPKSTCERWDLEFLDTEESPIFNPWDTLHRGGTIIRGKAIYYQYHN